MPVDTETDGQHGEDIEYDDTEESRFDGTGDSDMRASRLACSERDEFDTTERVERVDECLRERAESTDERLAVAEVGKTLYEQVSTSRPRSGISDTYRSWVADDSSPVVDKPDDDEQDDEDDFDHREPVLRLAWKEEFVERSKARGDGSRRTVYAYVNELHGKNRDDDNNRPFPCLQFRCPVLATDASGKYSKSGYR